MDNLIFYTGLVLATICGVALFVGGIWVGNRLANFIGYCLGISMMVWGTVLVATAVALIFKHGLYGYF